jgi:hypothetical protein
MLLLDLFLTFITWCMTLHVMMNASGAAWAPQAGSGPFGMRLGQFVASFHPDTAWAVLLCAAVFLYLGMVPGRRTAAMQTGL